MRRERGLVGAMVLLALSAGVAFVIQKREVIPPSEQMTETKTGVVDIGDTETGTVVLDGAVVQADQTVEAGIHQVVVDEPGKLPARYDIAVPGDGKVAIAANQPAGAVLGSTGSTTATDVFIDPRGPAGRATIIDGETIRLMPVPTAKLGTPAVARPTTPSPTTATTASSQPSATSTSAPPTVSPTASPTSATTQQPSNVLPEALPESASIPLSVIGENPLLDVTWTPTAERALLTSLNESGSNDVAIFTISTQTYTLLENVDEAIWSEDGSKLFTLTVTDKTVIEQRGQDGSSPRVISLDISPRSHGLATNQNGNVLAWYHVNDEGKVVVHIATLSNDTWATKEVTIDRLASPVLWVAPNGSAVAFREVRDGKPVLAALHSNGNKTETTVAPMDEFWQWSAGSSSFWILAWRAERPELGATTYAIERWSLANTREKEVLFDEPTLWEVAGFAVSNDEKTATLIIGPEVQAISVES